MFLVMIMVRSFVVILHLLPPLGKTEGAIALVFTGDEFADGGDLIASTLRQQNIKASFFFTGRFYKNPDF
jgi:hypothetical protein